MKYKTLPIMKYEILPVTAFNQNCSLIWCERTHQAVLIDPGGDADKLTAAINHKKVTISKILLTHGHLDHVGAAAQLAKHFQVPIHGPAVEDRFLLEKLPIQSKMFGLDECQPFEPTCWLKEGDEITIGDIKLMVLHCPGHTPGHIVFINRKDRLALVGDVIFHGSVGRTDFPGSSHSQLISSIRNKLLPLGDDITFIPGHGKISTFGDERKHNPFIS